VELSPLCTSATEWPIVPAPGDCDDGEFGGMKIGRGNRSIRKKTAPAPLRSPQFPRWNPGRRRGKPATNRLSCSVATFTHLTPLLEVCDNPDQSEYCYISGLWDFICDLALGWLHSTYCDAAKEGSHIPGEENVHLFLFAIVWTLTNARKDVQIQHPSTVKLCSRNLLVHFYSWPPIQTQPTSDIRNCGCLHEYT
jgi:hypothetical protein